MLNQQPHIIITLVLCWLDEYDLYCCSCACKVLHNIVELLQLKRIRGTPYDMIRRCHVYSFEAFINDTNVDHCDIKRLISLTTKPIQLYCIYFKLASNEMYKRAIAEQCVKLRCYRLLKKLRGSIMSSDIAMLGARMNDEVVLSLINKEMCHADMVYGYARAGNVAMLASMKCVNDVEKLTYYAYMSRDKATIDYVVSKYGVCVRRPSYLLYIAISRDDVRSFTRHFRRNKYNKRLLKSIISYNAVNIVRSCRKEFEYILVVDGRLVLPIPTKEMCEVMLLSSKLAFSFLIRYMIYDVIVMMRPFCKDCKRLMTIAEDSPYHDYIKMIVSYD